MQNRLIFGLVALCLTAATEGADTLVGFARLPADSGSDGPTWGRFAERADPSHPLPLTRRQWVQGFSAVLAGPTPGTFYFMTDNGLGTKANSADALLRLYAVKPDFRTAVGGTGEIFPADARTGARLDAFSAASHIDFNDASRLLGLPIQADLEHFYADGSKDAVDPEIRAQRLLTGADLDPESIRRDRAGHFWIGDEFGPFIVETDAKGRVVHKAMGLPGVQSPDNPELGDAKPSLPRSGGFEGMALDRSGLRLYTLLEKRVEGDPPGSLRINVFDLQARTFLQDSWRYPLDEQGTAIGDMTAVDDHRFLVIERNDGTLTTELKPFKRLYLIDLRRLDARGALVKRQVLDLMSIADPADLNDDGSTQFSFPFVTIESLLILDDLHLLIANDNNYPAGGGRGAAADETELVVVHLGLPLSKNAPR